LKDVTKMEVLGEGASGVVYKGKWQDKEIAIKEIKRKNNTDNMKYLEQFRTFSHEVFIMRYPLVLLLFLLNSFH